MMQECRGVAAIDARAAGVASTFSMTTILRERIAAEGLQEARAGDGLVLVGHQQAALRSGRLSAEYQAHQNRQHQRDSQRDESWEGIAAHAGPIFAQADGEEVHGYSRSSLPVSLMKRLSRLGWVRLVPRTSAPAAANAEKIAGKRREASGSARISRFSSACRISTRSIGCIAAFGGVGLEDAGEAQQIALREQRAKFRQRAGGDHFTVVHDGQPMAQRLRLFHIVSGVEDASSGLRLRADQFEQAHAALRIDPDGGLIEQQHFGLMDDAAGEIEAPPHAAAELLDGLAGAVGKAGDFEHFLNALAEQGIAHALRAAPIVEIFESRQVVVERDFLGNHAEHAARGGALAHHVVAHDANVAGSGSEQAGDAADGGGFAGAVGAEQAEDLAGRAVKEISLTAVRSPYVLRSWSTSITVRARYHGPPRQ